MGASILKVGVFGTSGMAREAGDIAWSLGLDVFYIARDAEEVDRWNGFEEVVLESELEIPDNTSFAIGIGDPFIRKRIVERYSNLEFVNLIHPSVTFGKGQRERLERATGVIVAAGARLTNSIDIGNFSIINQNVTVAHDCRIGEFVHIAPGANLSGNVYVSDDVWVGAGAIVNQGDESEPLKLGEGCIVGSGAVVIRDCESGKTYVGAPARKLM